MQHSTQHTVHPSISHWDLWQPLWLVMASHTQPSPHIFGGSFEVRIPKPFWGCRSSRSHPHRLLPILLPTLPVYARCHGYSTTRQRGYVTAARGGVA